MPPKYNIFGAGNLKWCDRYYTWECLYVEGGHLLILKKLVRIQILLKLRRSKKTVNMGDLIWISILMLILRCYVKRLLVTFQAYLIWIIYLAPFHPSGWENHWQ